MKYAVVDMPIESIHGMAFRAALGARCAGDQGKYWEMRARLFDNPKTLDQLGTHARALGLQGDQFDSCLTSGRYVDDIRGDLKQGQAAGIDGTPSFLLATVGEGGRLKVQRVLRGAQPFAAFKSQIDSVLAGQ